MKSAQRIKKIAIETLETEAKAINGLKKYINDDFVRSVRLIYASKGRVVITGIGKSAIVANKIVATLNSTGTPSIFMHAADAIHGDLGTIQKEDIVICISKSGNTAEIKVIVPLLKSWGNRLIAVIGNADSYLAKQADFVLNTSVDREACPNNLAPTSSSTAQLAMGDALAISLLEYRGFLSSDFAKFHPGGTLGKQLYLKVDDIYVHHQLPKVSIDDDVKSVIIEISSKRLGATAVLKKEKLVGIITDGDLRRMLEKKQNITKLKAKDIMTGSPKTIEKGSMAVDALQIIKQNNITQLLVTDKSKYVGIVHLHDLLREGIL